MKYQAIVLIYLSMFLGTCLASESVDLTAEEAKTSYSIGYQVGGDLKGQGIEVRPEMLLKGVQDAMGDQQPAMSPIEMHQTLVELQNKVTAEQGAANKDEESKKTTE
jgi:FKBP-type peptidyl-prolyl cis-trans isomerase